MNEAEDRNHRKLRILVIAYEFPPSQSPQSLRWTYLAGRLASFGHEVHVMAPAIEGRGEGLPGLPGVGVHRVDAGPFRAALKWLQDAMGRGAPAGGQSPAGSGATRDAPKRRQGLSWKGRSRQWLQQALSRWVFPDLRGEWKRPAMEALAGLLDDLQPDVVVSSHEPATTLELGLLARSRGFRWVADLADPVLATYTPARWRRRAGELERRVLGEAEHVVVTNAVASDLLIRRHGRQAPISIIPQGFDEALGQAGLRRTGKDEPLDLLYSGSFYSFRDPSALVEAVLGTDGARLQVAGAIVPRWLEAAARAHPDKLVLLGQVPHRELLALQQRAGVLVDLANADGCHVPGKFYEYLGAGRPILHLQANPRDPVADLLLSLRRGWVCPGAPAAVRTLLATLVDRHRRGTLDDGLDLTSATVATWSWTSAAKAMEAVLAGPGGRRLEAHPEGVQAEFR